MASKAAPESQGNQWAQSLLSQEYNLIKSSIKSG
jgi:hypothetical protein